MNLHPGQGHKDIQNNWPLTEVKVTKMEHKNLHEQMYQHSCLDRERYSRVRKSEKKNIINHCI